MARRRRSKINQARKATHRATVLLGDVRAIQTGRIGQRVVNRVVGRGVSRLLRGVWR